MLSRATVAAMIAVLLLVPHVHAANGEWTTVASACVPAPSSAGYTWSGSAVFLPGPATVVLRCNVTAPADFANFMDPVWDTIEVTYRDSDGMANDSRVLVQLWRVGKATGLTSLAGTFDSNAFAAGTLNSANFFSAFDFTNFAYFLQLNLTRTAAGGDTRIYRVRLW
jgi:hypothetical protein